MAKPPYQGKKEGMEQGEEFLSQEGSETDQNEPEAGKANTTKRHAQICF